LIALKKNIGIKIIKGFSYIKVINLKAKVMNQEIIKVKFNHSVKRALSGELTGLDIKNIIKYQCKEFGELSELEVRLLLAASIAFN
jgi:hypothetical protein